MHSRHAVCCDYVRVVPKYFEPASECKCSGKQNIYLKKKKTKSINMQKLGNCQCTISSCSLC